MTGTERAGSGEAESGAARRDADATFRTTAVASVGGSLVVWWPAFTIGAYGQVFFPQILALWAVSTAVLLCALILRPPGAGLRTRWIALTLPSVWIVLSILTPPGGEGVQGLVVNIVSAVLTLVGTPFLAWLLLRIVIVGYVELSRRQRLTAVLITVIIAVISLVLGEIHHLYLTCADFTISGNDTPRGCSPR
ncbi:MAG: hypothetical protein WCA46_26015 [Actinocatenispora sp.]